MWNTEYQFAFKNSILASNGKVIRAGWASQVQNAGLKCKDPSTGELVSCRAKDGMYGPMLLKEDGTQAGKDDDPVYPEADFEGLNMPEDLFSAGTPEPPPEEPEDP